MGVNICGCHKLETQVIKNIDSLKAQPNIQAENPNIISQIRPSRPTFLNTEQNELEEILKRDAFESRVRKRELEFRDLNEPKVGLIKAYRNDGKTLISLNSEISYEVERRRLNDEGAKSFEEKEVVP